MQTRSIGEPLFLASHKENRWLSDQLSAIFVHKALGLVGTFTLDRFAEDLDLLVDEILATTRVEPPELIGDPRLVHEGVGSFKPMQEAGAAEQTSRFYLAIRLSGEADLLNYWPDEEGAELEPVDVFDGDPWEKADPAEPYDFERALRLYEFKLASQRWSIGYVGDDLVLRTFVDLTSAEVRAVRHGGHSAKAVAIENLEKVRPIIEAVSAQTRNFFDDELPGLVRDSLEGRHSVLLDYEAVRQDLSWPDEWTFDPPVLEQVPVDTAQPASDDTQLPTSVSVPHTSRLEEASFERLVKTIRVWTNAVERYPAAFAALEEERLSDLLAATLNATLPGAGREVFSRGGKTDLYVQANAFDEGNGPEKVFICECKKWAGAGVIPEVLDQIFGYLTARDTSCVLIFFEELATPGHAADAGLSAIREQEEYVETSSDLASWPVVRLRVEERNLEMCVVFVRIYPKQVAAE